MMKYFLFGFFKDHVSIQDVKVKNKTNSNYHQLNVVNSEVYFIL